MTDRDYIDYSRSMAEKMTGNTVEEIDAQLPAHFALHGMQRRAQILDEIDRTLPRGELDPDNPGELRAAFDKAELRNRLREIHEVLRKAGR